MPQTWFTSDTHFCHDRGFLYEPRGFTNVEDMNNEIIKKWNSVVQPDDIVYHCGDVMLNNDTAGIKCLSQLNGKIYIAIGNHDSDSRVQLYTQCRNVADVQMGYRIKVGKKILIITHYPTIVTNFEEERPVVINICGHSHTKDKFKDIQYGCYHVELDAHDNCPVDLLTVLSDVRLKKTSLTGKND